MATLRCLVQQKAPTICDIDGLATGYKLSELIENFKSKLSHEEYSMYTTDIDSSLYYIKSTFRSNYNPRNDAVCDPLSGNKIIGMTIHLLKNRDPEKINVLLDRIIRVNKLSKLHVRLMEANNMKINHIQSTNYILLNKIHHSIIISGFTRTVDFDSEDITKLKILYFEIEECNLLIAQLTTCISQLKDEFYSSQYK